MDTSINCLGLNFDFDVRKILGVVFKNGTLLWASLFRCCLPCYSTDFVTGCLLKFLTILGHLVETSMFLSVTGNFCSLSFEVKT